MVGTGLTQPSCSPAFLPTFGSPLASPGDTGRAPRPFDWKLSSTRRCKASSLTYPSHIQASGTIKLMIASETTMPTAPRYSRVDMAASATASFCSQKSPRNRTGATENETQLQREFVSSSSFSRCPLSTSYPLARAHIVPTSCAVLFPRHCLLFLHRYVFCIVSFSPPEFVAEWFSSWHLFLSCRCVMQLEISLTCIHRVPDRLEIVHGGGQLCAGSCRSSAAHPA